jgi:diacylglycerol kinase (ATP)
MHALREIGRKRGVQCDFLETKSPAHIERLVRQVVEDGDRRLAVLGGDGTVSQVVDGILRVKSALELAILPAGRGNDVARSLDIPRRNLGAALDIAINGRSRHVDVGRCGKRCFLSVLGAGFPAEVAKEADRLKVFRGSPAFFFGMYKALYRMRAVPVEIRLDDRVWGGVCTSVMIQNTPFTGGGLLIAPRARIDDGCLDVVIVNDIGRLNLMLNFPKVYRGLHLSHPSFSVYRCARVSVRSMPEMALMFDGEVFGSTPVEASVLRRRIEIVVPTN